MRPPKVFAFIISSFAAILLMSFAIDKTIGKDSSIKYFSIEEIIGYNKFKAAKIEEEAKIKEENARIKFEKELMASINSLADSISANETIADIDSARFWLPDDDRNFWNDLFRQWDNLKNNKRLFRILHYGDSQIEMDRITAYIREKLQEEFGGGGPGLLPAVQLVPTYSISQQSSENWKRFVSYGVGNDRAAHNRYGVSGMLFKFDSTSTATVSISPRYKGKSPNLQRFRTVKVISGHLSSPMKVSLSYNTGRNTQILAPKNTEQMIRWNFKTNQPRFNLTFEGDSTSEVLGIAIDDKWGIAMDNIPWRGSSGLTFTSINKASLIKTYKFLDVKMVIMQFGGNSVPHLKNEKMIENFANRFGKQIDYIKSIDPKLKILVIGPSDMSINEQGEMVSNPILETVIEKMRIIANEKGAAYWSIYHAMGGKNSMARWVKSSPALGAPDYIHFTQKGADEISYILKNAIWREYEIYKMKNRLAEKDKPQTKEIEIKETENSSADEN